MKNKEELTREIGIKAVKKMLELGFSEKEMNDMMLSALTETLASHKEKKKADDTEN